MKQPVFEGLATALVTPFKNGTTDIPTFEKLIDTQLAAGVDALVVCGTTGESSTMSAQEQLSLIAHAVRYAAGRCKIIAGTGSNDTSHAVELSRAAAAMGADAVLVVTPYYNKCTQSGLIAHYTAIADESACPVICYNVPSRTGLDMKLETCEVLSHHPNIQGIKEAGGSPAKIAKLVARCAGDFFVWSGNDDEAVSTMALGGKGLISVLSNVRPKKTAAMLRACQAGDFNAAGALQRELLPLIDALFCEVNPIPVKRALQLEGLNVGAPRLPLTELSEGKVTALKAALEQISDT